MTISLHSRTSSSGTLAVLWSVCAMLHATTGHAQPAQSFARIDSIFARYDSTTTPGCGVAVLRGDSVVLRKTYGMAHIGFGVPMSSATTTWIPYSEARVFTALAAAMLARDGAISLDDPVRRHVPELPAYAGAVTVRHLVHHTSGLADYGVLYPGFDLSDRMSEDEFFRVLTRWGKLSFAPGSDHVYSNTDYALLKILVERVAHLSLDDYLQNKLLQPLGMRGTRIGFDQSLAVPNHALFHEPVAGGGWRSVHRYRISPVGGISVTTSLDDLVRWARAVRDTTSGIPALLRSLQDGALESQRAEGFSFGVYRGSHRGRAFEAHRGVGHYLYLTRGLEADISVVTLCNAYGGMDLFGPAVLAYVAPASYTAAATAATTAPLPTRSVAVGELRRYAGEYVLLDGTPAGVRFHVPDSVLVMTLPNGQSVRTRALGGGQFELATGPGATALLTFAPSDSTPGGTIMTGVDAATGEPAGPALRRRVATSPPHAALRAYAGTYVGGDVDATLLVAVNGSRATIASRGMAAVELRPESDDGVFRMAGYVVRFERDRAGRVTHLVLDHPRVKGMRYTRRPGR
ncbi:MAG: serine hydrolase [Gemmatimonadaceae bacterium]